MSILRAPASKAITALRSTAFPVPAAVAPNTSNVMYSLLGVGDTTGALAVAQRVAQRNPDAPLEARFFAAHFRGDMARAIALADSAARMSARAWRRHLAYLAVGDIAAARVAIDTLRLEDAAAYVPNAVLNLGLTELALGGDRAAIARHFSMWSAGWPLQRKSTSHRISSR